MLRKAVDFEQKCSEGQKAGAKAVLILEPFAARLKSCPYYKTFLNLGWNEFFPQPVKPLFFRSYSARANWRRF